MKTPEEIIREMREYAEHLRSLGASRAVFAVSFCRWADALEAAMREPVAEYTALPDGLEWRFRPQIFDPPVGTKLYAFPPDAEEEIERLRDRLKWFEDSGGVAVHAEVFKRGAEIEHCRKDAERMQKEIDLLRDALQSIVTHQRSAAAVIRIADAALAKEEDK